MGWNVLTVVEATLISSLIEQSLQRDDRLSDKSPVRYVWVIETSRQKKLLMQTH